MNAVTQPKIPDYASARNNMVDGQLRPNKVYDERILGAMGGIAREMFVPFTMVGIAYIDEDLQVAEGRYLLEPMVLARLLQEVQIKPTDRALDIAPTTGYSTAVMAAIAKEVTALECDPSLQQQATNNLKQLKIDNAKIKLGPLNEGWKLGAPYDVILINGCADIVSDELFAQLAEGGRLVTVIRQKAPAAQIGEARLYEKIHGNISHRALFDANVKLLPAFEAKPSFRFE